MRINLESPEVKMQEALSQIKQPELLAQYRRPDGIYIGNINDSMARRFCKKYDKNASLISVDDNNDVVVCKGKAISGGFPFQITLSSHVEEHQTHFDQVCDTLYQRYRTVRKPSMGRYSKPGNNYFPIYNNFRTEGTACYADKI